MSIVIAFYVFDRLSKPNLHSCFVECQINVQDSQLLFSISHSLYAVLAKKHGRVQEQIKQAEQNPHQAMQDDFPQDFVSS